MVRSIEIAVRYKGLKVDRKKLRRLIETLDKASARFKGGCPDGELSLALVKDAELAQMHGEFLDDPSTTDVITFEGAPEFGVAGEVCVSVDTAKRYAAEHGREFSTELSLYLIHGWLHLAGYDDLKPELKREMRRAEARAEKLLGEAGLLDAFELKTP